LAIFRPNSETQLQVFDRVFKILILPLIFPKWKDFSPKLFIFVRQDYYFPTIFRQPNFPSAGYTPLRPMAHNG